LKNSTTLYRPSPSKADVNPAKHPNGAD